MVRYSREGLSFDEFRKQKIERKTVSITPEAFRKIMETEHGYRIEDAVPIAFSKPDYAGFTGASPVERILLESIRRRCEAQLRTPMLWGDAFGEDHEQRRDFIHEMEERYGDVANDFFQHNTLKKAYGVSIVAEIKELAGLLSQKETKTPEMCAFQGLAEDLPLSEAKTATERERMVKEVDQAARAFLRIVKVLP